jgi:hypothetical protein
LVFSQGQTALWFTCQLERQLWPQGLSVDDSIDSNFYPMFQGYDCTVGCSEFIDQPYPDDAVTVQVAIHASLLPSICLPSLPQVLKEQGAIPFVKTNVPQTMIRQAFLLVFITPSLSSSLLVGRLRIPFLD